MFKKFVAALLILVIGGTAFAGPFFCRPLLRRPLFPLFNRQPPTVITPWCESREERLSAQEPSSPISEADDIYSPVQATALEGVPGTGSKSLIIPKLPADIGVKLDPELMKQIALMVAASQQKQPSVGIHLPLEDSTSQRLSRISMLLEVLLWLGGAFGVTSLGGKSLPLVARMASGLLNVLQPNAQNSSTATTASTSSPPSR